MQEGFASTHTSISCTMRRRFLSLDALLGSYISSFGFVKAGGFFWHSGIYKLWLEHHSLWVRTPKGAIGLVLRSCDFIPTLKTLLIFGIRIQSTLLSRTKTLNTWQTWFIYSLNCNWGGYRFLNNIIFWAMNWHISACSPLWTPLGGERH